MPHLDLDYLVTFLSLGFALYTLHVYHTRQHLKLWHVLLLRHRENVEAIGRLNRELSECRRQLQHLSTPEQLLEEVRHIDQQLDRS